MHELGTTADILRLVIGEAKRQHAQKVLRVIIKVGAISSMMPEYIQYYFKQISQNTIAAGAELEIKRTPLVQRCRECGFTEIGERFNASCQQCGEKHMQVITGMELVLDSIEFE